MSTLNFASVKDGLSYTYLLGENPICPDMYLSGQSNGDNENQYIGFNQDIGRWNGLIRPCRIDRVTTMPTPSARPTRPDSTWHSAMVRPGRFLTLSNPTTHQQLGNRNDGEPTQLQNLEQN